jgi:hypothetical protein
MIAAQTNPPNNRTAPSPATGKRWTRFEKAVPEPVRQALVQRLAREVDQRTRAAVFDAFALAEQYGVTRRQFRRFADHVPYVNQTLKPGLQPVWPIPGSPLAQIYRDWMDRACSMLKNYTEKLSTDDAATWEHAVYMALLIRLFAMLSGQATDLPFRNLTGASQLINGARRTQSPASPGKHAKEDWVNRELSKDELRTVVRELYGLDMQD